MSTSSTHTSSTATTTRKLRTLLDGWMEDAGAPPICARIRATRERLKEEARAAGGASAASEYTQEQVAQRVGVTLAAYRKWEKNREPRPQRRQQIAKALRLPPDYFEVHPEDEQLRRIVHEELADVRDVLGRVEEILERREEQPPSEADSS